MVPVPLLMRGDGGGSSRAVDSNCPTSKPWNYGWAGGLAVFIEDSARD